MNFIEIPKWKLDIVKNIKKSGKGKKTEFLIDKEKIKAMKRLDKWVSYFSSKTKPEELEAIAMTEPTIQEALNAEVVFTQDKASWWGYEKAEKVRRDKIAQMKYAKKEGILESKIEDIKNIMDSLNISAQKAMDVLKIPESDHSKYIALL